MIPFLVVLQVFEKMCLLFVIVFKSNVLLFKDRYHSLGMPPYNIYGRVPGLSHYFHDIVPYYLCCHWSDQCESYLYLRQTKDAIGYKEPRTGFDLFLNILFLNLKINFIQINFSCSLW